MSKVYEYIASPRKHAGKNDNEIHISGIQNKIRSLDNTESLNIVIKGSDDLVAYYQIPVHQLHMKTDLYLRPWTAQAAGATSLTNVLPNRKSKWGNYMTSSIDPNKRFDLPSLEHLFTEGRQSRREISKAEKIRRGSLDPLSFFDENES
jgi:hypothetical protein